jgi:hypothetical protein
MAIAIERHKVFGTPLPGMANDEDSDMVERKGKNGRVKNGRLSSCSHQPPHRSVYRNATAFRGQPGNAVVPIPPLLSPGGWPKQPLLRAGLSVATDVAAPRRLSSPHDLPHGCDAIAQLLLRALNG